MLQLKAARLLACCLACVVATLGTSADAASDKNAELVIDANTGAVLHNRSGDELRHPASLTKMMTLYLLFETLDSGRLTMSSPVPMSAHAASAPPSKLGIEVGDSLTVRQAILSLVTKSANDVARAVAERVGGTESNFVRLMNTRARELGMSKTVFRNPSGLPDIKQVTTARDMVTLALHLQDDFPEHYKLFKTRSFQFGRKNYRNHNTLLGRFQGTDGVKTGYTRMSGFNLVSSVRRGNRHVVAAVFGGSTAARRNRTMQTILTRFIPRASTRKTRAPQLLSRLRQAPQLAQRSVKPPVRKPVLAAAPRPAERPVRQAFAAPTAPTVFKPTMATEPTLAQRQLAAVAATAAATEILTPTSPQTPVEVFKVKRVAFTGPKPADAYAPLTRSYDPETTTDTYVPHHVANSADPIGALVDFGHPSAATTIQTAALTQETVVPKRTRMVSAALPPSEPANYAQGLSRLGAALPAPASAPAAPTRAPATAPARPRVVASALRPGGGYVVQVGAYGSKRDASEMLASAQRKAEPYLKSAFQVTEPVQSKGRTYFRARFAGFDARAAAQACSELRRHAVDCFVAAAN